MAHSINRTTPPIPPVGGGEAGPLSLEEATRTEWDSLVTRDDRWVTCRSGITDPDEPTQELEWLQLSNPSGSVTYRVLERTITCGSNCSTPHRLLHRGAAAVPTHAPARVAHLVAAPALAPSSAEARTHLPRWIPDRATRQTTQFPSTSQPVERRTTSRRGRRPSCPWRKG